MQQETLTLKLLKPVTLGDVQYDHIDLAEPTAGQIEKAGNNSNGVTSNIILISEVAKVPQAVVRLLCKRDMEAAVDYLSGFTAEDRKTGEM